MGCTLGHHLLLLGLLLHARISVELVVAFRTAVVAVLTHSLQKIIKYAAITMTLPLAGMNASVHPFLAMERPLVLRTMGDLGDIEAIGLLLLVELVLTLPRHFGRRLSQ